MFELAIIAAIVTIGAVASIKIVRKSGDYEAKVIRKQLKALENYTLDIEEELKSSKTRESRMQRGPSVSGDTKELDAVLPDLVSQFSPYAPKWLRPLLENQETQKFIIDYIQKNPDKLQGWVSKFVKSKGESTSSNGQAADII